MLSIMFFNLKGIMRLPHRFASCNDRNPLFLRLLKPPSGITQKRTESAFKRTQKLKKWQFYYPDFGVFLLFQNHQTLINSHFNFLNIRKFSQKSAIFEGKSISRSKKTRLRMSSAFFSQNPYDIRLSEVRF